MNRALGLLLIALALPGKGTTQEQPVVEIAVTPESVLVGESAELRVTVLVPTWFTSPPVFPTFEIANTITRLPPDSSYPTSKRIGGATWAGIVRNYRVTPLLGANYRISGQTLRVKYANPGSDPLVAETVIPDVQLRATVPEGAESLNPYLAGRDLQLAREIIGEIDSLAAGDAVVIKYTAELDGLPAIFLPPLVPDLQIEGVSVYADSPLVEDGSPARRTEKITLVFTTGGEITLPGLELAWWNTELGKLETASLGELSFPVSGPAPSRTKSESQISPDWPFILSWLAALSAITVVGWRAVPALFRRLRAAVQAHRQSEAYAFSQLRSALRSQDSKPVYQLMLEWLKRLGPAMDSRRFARDYGDAIFTHAINQLIAAAYSDTDSTPDLSGFDSALILARKRYIASQRAAARSAIPQLNP